MDGESKIDCHVNNEDILLRKTKHFEIQFERGGKLDKICYMLKCYMQCYMLQKEY